MLRTVACDPAGKDLPSLGYISFQLVDILIADLVILLATEHTYFFSSNQASSMHFVFKVREGKTEARGQTPLCCLP